MITSMHIAFSRGHLVIEILLILEMGKGSCMDYFLVSDYIFGRLFAFCVRVDRDLCESWHLGYI